ncbi:branched-chain amino acid aminotransferase [Pedobacter hartonius]|uniref:branched-chain amino acid aminotransferase n=1 Tax=Pedobacter hartonius TaxID=425514 RepID=UPI000B8718C6|nr:branched-chain amino acid aminotransferase [Pedobacter hartonius]
MIETLTIKTTRTDHSRLAELDKTNLPFGKYFTDHMFVADYEDGEWKNFAIVPYGPIPMSPASSVIHYGQTIFEGLKAYRQADGSVSVFRAGKNLERMNKSAVRMAMPTLPEEIFMQGLAALIDIDRAWVPDIENYSLYIRPTMFATDAFLGVRPSLTYKFMILMSPSAPYYSKPLKVKIETKYTRSVDGGVGAAKTAGNYAMAMLPTVKAHEEGFDQLIWTDAKEHKYVEESGAANLMFVVDGKILTPEVRETILDGVTRDTVIQLAKSTGYEVEERRVSIHEVLEYAESGRLTEAFAVGTAATITQIYEMNYEGKAYPLTDLSTRTVSNGILAKLNQIRYGLTADEFGWNWIL